MIMLADSIGFAGTNTITQIISADPESHIMHGPQSDTSRPDEPKNMAPGKFLDLLLKAERQIKNVIAIHALYRPHEVVRLCEDRGINYIYIVRNQEQQVRSCYAWALKKVVSGADAEMFEQLQGLSRNISAFAAPTLANSIYAYALIRVCGFNIEGIKAGARHVKMEDLLGSENLFKETFNIDPDTKLPHFDGNKIFANSHRDRTKEFNIGDPDADLIQANIVFGDGAGKFKFKDVVERLGYAN